MNAKTIEEATKSVPVSIHHEKVQEPVPDSSSYSTLNNSNFLAKQIIISKNPNSTFHKQRALKSTTQCHFNNLLFGKLTTNNNNDLLGCLQSILNDVACLFLNAAPVADNGARTADNLSGFSFLVVLALKT